jgi:hypothetical glycosyl hydrolase
LPAHWRKPSFLAAVAKRANAFLLNMMLTVESSTVTLTLWGKTLNVSGLQIFAT